MMMISILFFVFCLVNRSTSHNIDGVRGTLLEDLQLEKFINKSHVKSIHTKFGYIVDCIDIDKQPAFDNPLLKNHKLQRKPTFQRIVGKASVDISQTKSKFGLEKRRCPRGTVPIQKITKDDHNRAKSSTSSNMLSQAIPGSHVAEVLLKAVPGTSFYGVRGTTSVYNPRVEKNQSSSAIMWVRNGPTEVSNVIVVGWHVRPQLYNDDKTHLFALWTADNFKTTGCFNLLCPGFVQTNKAIFPGIAFNRTSVYGGLMIEVPISIAQDPTTKDWWFNIGEENIGYFPASLFSIMSSAEEVGWGGKTITSVGTPSPPMGSGYLPDGLMVHACYFSNVAFLDDSRTYQGPDKNKALTFTDNPKCFGVKYYGDQLGVKAGLTLQFGGPGGNCGD